MPVVPPLDLKFLNGQSETNKLNNYITKNSNILGF